METAVGGELFLERMIYVFLFYAGDLWIVHNPHCPMEH